MPKYRYEATVYEAPDGSRPVEEYLLGLTKTMPNEVGRVIYLIRLLRTFGLELGGDYTENLGGGLFYLRSTGRHAHRVLYFAIDGPKFVLLHAFYKVTPKIPPEEETKARTEMADYLARKERT